MNPRCRLSTPDGEIALFGSLHPRVVFVHGTPSSTAEFRSVAEAFESWASVDHLGFGASDKPSEGYGLQDHQRRFSAAMDALEIRDAVFVLHDVGAAIALPWMLAHPERVAGVVLANTFLWSAEGVGRWMMRAYASPVGRWLYLQLNLSARYLVPLAWGGRRPLDAASHEVYLSPFPTPETRYGPAAWPGELASGAMAAMEEHAAALGQWPVRGVWGMADPFVGADALARWRDHLGAFEVVELPDVGHFVADEAPDAIIDAIRALRS